MVPPNQSQRTTLNPFNLPAELLNHIFGQLEQRDISSCVQTCKAFQALLEPVLYSKFVFTGHTGPGHLWLKPTHHAIQAKPLRLFFRSLSSRPALGRFLRRLEYSGPSRQLQTRIGLGEGEHLPRRMTRGSIRRREIPVQQAWEEELSSTFEQHDFDLLQQLETQLRAQLAATAAANTLHDEEQAEASSPAIATHEDIGWSSPEMMLRQGVALAMLDIIILLSPNLTNISISINVETLLRGPFRLHSLRFANTAPSNDVYQLTKFSCLISFDFEIGNQQPSVTDSALHAQDITTLLSLGNNLKSLRIRFVGLQPVSWPMLHSYQHSQPMLKSLESMTLAPSYPNMEQLNTWLSAAPVLKTLDLHILVDVNFEKTKLIDCERLAPALEHVQSSLERLELYFCTNFSSSQRLVDDILDAGVRGCIGSLTNFHQLNSLVISLAILIGSGMTPQNAPKLANLLPHNLQRFWLIEDDDGLGFDWHWETTQMLYTEFLTRVHETHPQLCYFRLLSDSFEDASVLERRELNTLIEDCARRGVIFEITSREEWELKFRFENGYSGFFEGENLARK